MRILRLVLAISLLAPLAGCFVRTGPQPVARGCGGGYHWDDGRCVHNGRGHDHDDDDHGHGHGHGHGHD